jgi:hypothetical protein
MITPRESRMLDDHIINGRWHKCCCGGRWSDSDGGPCHVECRECGKPTESEGPDLCPECLEKTKTEDDDENPVHPD